MNLVLTTPPASEPVTIDELKEHLRVVGVDDDTYISALGSAARSFAENYQDASYLTQTWTAWLRAFPGRRYIKLRRRPIQSIAHIKYYDTDDVADTMSTDDYMLDESDGRIWLNYSKSWPSTILRPAKAVEIEYVAGYTSTANLLHERAYVVEAIKQIVAHMYQNRIPIAMAGSPQVIPLTAIDMLDSDRVVHV